MYSLFCNITHIKKLFPVLGLFILTPICLAITNEADVKDIGVEEKLGTTIPPDLRFYDESGDQILLSSLFKDEKPVILSLLYYSCPRVCSYVLKGIVESVNGLESLTLGNDYKIVSISFNPEDTPELANKKSQKYKNELKEKVSSDKDWSFLTGDQANILKLTQAVGFKYKKDGEEYAHPTTLIILTPQRKISRYLYGIQSEPNDLKLALLEASDGEIGTSEILNKVMLFCYEFDPVGKRYALQALRVVKAGGVITLLTLAGFLTYYWRREKKESR